MRDASIAVDDVPAELRGAVENDARERGMSRNDVIGQLLAARFNQEWPLGGRGYMPTDGSDTWILRVPERLRAAIRDQARSSSAPGRAVTQRGIVLLVLSDHYGLPIRSPRKRTVPTSLTPEVIAEARARHEAGESIRSLAKRFRVKRETLTRAIREE